MLFNRTRALEYMDRCKLDALVATSPVNITYFTDYHCAFDTKLKEHMIAPGLPSELIQAYAIFPREGEPALVVNPSLAVNAADLWIRDLHVFGKPSLDSTLPPAAIPTRFSRYFDLLCGQNGNSTPTDALLSILKARGLDGARIGIERKGLTPLAAEALVNGLPHAAIQDCTNLLYLIRMVKTTDEIERLAQAAAIGEQAALESLMLARPRCPMADVVHHYRVRVAEMGADFDHFMFGVHGLGFATETEYRLADDDVLFVDFGCIFGQCYSDTGLTLAMRPLSEPLRERFSALRECMVAGRESIRPGAPASAVQAAMQQAMSVHGITACFPHGHGLGLEMREYPILVPDNGLHIGDDCVRVPSDLPVEAGMMLNLEASLFMPGVGSLHSEESFVVTETGCRPLVAQQRDEPYVPA